MSPSTHVTFRKRRSRRYRERDIESDILGSDFPTTWNVLPVEFPDIAVSGYGARYGVVELECRVGIFDIEERIYLGGTTGARNIVGSGYAGSYI